MEPWRVLGRRQGRLSLRPRRGRHEGRHRLQRRGGAANLADHGGKPRGSISFLITGDEEDISVNGTIKLLNGSPSAARNSTIACSASPRNVEALGDCIKIGRRGSQSGTLFVDGVQGHVAYPHRAANPVPDISRLIVALSDEPLDHGSAQFQASNLEFTSVDVGNTASNVIPAQARAQIQHPLQRQPHAGDAAGAGRGAAGKGLRQPHPRAHRMGAVELQRVRRPSPGRSPIWPRRDRRGDGTQAGTVDLGRHLGRALHLGLLPGDRIRPGRPDHARRSTSARRCRIWRS